MNPTAHHASAEIMRCRDLERSENERRSEFRFDSPAPNSRVHKDRRVQKDRAFDSVHETIRGVSQHLALVRFSVRYDSDESALPISPPRSRHELRTSDLPRSGPSYYEQSPICRSFFVAANVRRGFREVDSSTPLGKTGSRQRKNPARVDLQNRPVDSVCSTGSRGKSIRNEVFCRSPSGRRDPATGALGRRRAERRRNQAMNAPRFSSHRAHVSRFGFES